MRIKIIRITILCLFILIALDLIYVQVIRGKYFYNLSVNNRIRVVPLEGWRGRILDRNGEVLADNKIAYNVMVTPQEIRDEAALFSFLSETLGMDQEAIERTYLKKKFTPFAPVTVVEDISQQQAIAIEENRYRFPSLFIDEGAKRIYPHKRSTAHVIGYVGKINRAKMKRYKEYGYSPQSVIGYSGAEEFYDSSLKGGHGGLQVEVNSRGKQVRLLSIKEPSKGDDISLTIDSRLQRMAYDTLDGRVGAVVVMDINNGEILTMVSSPSFDPNSLVDKNKNRQSSYMFRNPNSPFLNRAIKGLFPPGSVFKVPVAIGALHSGKVSQYTPFDCPGYMEKGGIKFKCAHVHGKEDLVQSLAHSCNVYYYNLGLILGADKITEYAGKFGLGEKTEIDLPYESAGHIPNRRQGLLSKKRRWYTGDTINFSIGQGDVLTTPLQLVRMMATVARDGVEVKPHVIKTIGDQDVKKFDETKQVNIDQKFFNILKQGLRATVVDPAGTAHNLNVSNLYIAGKTGTAQTSGDLDSHSWFVGYAKGKRDIAFCVFLEYGGSSKNAVELSRELLVQMQEKEML